ncbi:MAG: ribosome silencing factor [Vampirovibrio sp.]|nr:ribosome silencing factor [Vampirovibrio sp.]
MTLQQLQTDLTPFEIATLAANTAESKKAIDTKVMETGKISSLSDYFVVCSADSKTQVKAVTDAILEKLEKQGQRPEHYERDENGLWFLLDYGDTVIHVMNGNARQFYQLEKYWSHANIVDRDVWYQEERQAS